MAKYRAVRPGSYGLKEETHYLYYASISGESAPSIPPACPACSVPIDTYIQGLVG